MLQKKRGRRLIVFQTTCVSLSGAPCPVPRQAARLQSKPLAPYDHAPAGPSRKKAGFAHLVVFAPADEELSVRRTRQRADGVAVPHEGQPAQLAGLGDVPQPHLQGGGQDGEQSVRGRGVRELAKMLSVGGIRATAARKINQTRWVSAWLAEPADARELVNSAFAAASVDAAAAWGRWACFGAVHTRNCTSGNVQGFQQRQPLGEIKRGTRCYDPRRSSSKLLQGHTTGEKNPSSVNTGTWKAR